MANNSKRKISCAMQQLAQLQLQCLRHRHRQSYQMTISQPADIIDDTGVNGVGMFFRNDGFVCTGTLNNPRTVLFAAHCVNDRPESDYGPVIRSAFSFDDNALPGFIQWINNGFQSFPDQFVYDHFTDLL